MNLLLMANQGLPRNGLIALYDPYRDTYGRNVLPVGREDFVTGWNSKANITSATVSEPDGEGWRTITFVVSDTTNYYRCPTTIGVTGYGNFQYQIVSGAFTKLVQNSAGVCYLGFGSIAQGTIVKVKNPQINIGALYPYSAPSGLPQSATDYTGKGNNAQLGSTAGADTNDPAWNGGLVFGADDYCVLPTLTDVDMTKQYSILMIVNTGTLISTEKCFWSKGVSANNRNGVSILNDKLVSTIYDGSSFIRKEATVSANTNYLFNFSCNNKTIKLKVNALTGIDSTTTCYATSSGHYIGYGGSTGKFADGTKNYFGAIYNRILSDAEYLRAYAYLKSLMNSRGVVI